MNKRKSVSSEESGAGRMVKISGGDQAFGKPHLTWFVELLTRVAERAIAVEKERRAIELAALEVVVGTVTPLSDIILGYTGSYGLYALSIPFHIDHLPVRYPKNAMSPPKMREFLMHGYRYGPTQNNNTLVVADMNTIRRLDYDGKIQTVKIDHSISGLWGSECGRYTCVAAGTCYYLIDWTLDRTVCANLPANDIVGYRIHHNGWSDEGQCFEFAICEPERESVAIWVSPLDGQVKHIAFKQSGYTLLTTNGQILSFSYGKLAVSEHAMQKPLVLPKPVPDGYRINTFAGNGFAFSNARNHPQKPHEAPAIGQSYLLTTLFGSP